MTRLYTEDQAMLIAVVAATNAVTAYAEGRFPPVEEVVARALAAATPAAPAAAPDLSRLAEAVRDRDVVALARIEACTSCEETFTTAEQAAFDPNDNDHCPECGERGTLTTYYGDPQWRIREGDLGIHTRAEDGRFVAEFLDLAPIIAASGTGAHVPALPVTDAGNALVDGLLAEAHAKAGRMGLPVVRTCADCRHATGSSCFHPDAPTTPDLGMPLLRTATPPPLECPLRTPGKEQKR